MPAWILICPKCRSEFQHSQVSDVEWQACLCLRNLRFRRLVTNVSAQIADTAQSTNEQI